MKTLLAPAALLALVTSCGGDTQSAAPVAPTGPHPLDGYYMDAAPEGAIEVAALRGLEDGATVTVRGDVQEFAPVKGKAVLSLYDHALLSCDEIEDDQCPTPWDFCCEDPADLTVSTINVEFLDGDLPGSWALKGERGLDHLTQVQVTGTLRRDGSGNVRLEASRIAKL